MEITREFIARGQAAQVAVDEILAADGKTHNRAKLFDEGLERALITQAKLVARLQIKRRKMRADLRRLEHELKTARRFLRGLTKERGQ